MDFLRYKNISTNSKSNKPVSATTEESVAAGASAVVSAGTNTSSLSSPLLLLDSTISPIVSTLSSSSSASSSAVTRRHNRSSTGAGAAPSTLSSTINNTQSLSALESSSFVSGDGDPQHPLSQTSSSSLAPSKDMTSSNTYGEVQYDHLLIGNGIDHGNSSNDRSRSGGIVTESHTRSLMKGLTWRLVATATTTIIAWSITGQIEMALQIGFFEFFAKLLIYYVHERIWVHIRL
jgi:uncharacterized membrane protein